MDYERPNPDGRHIEDWLRVDDPVEPKIPVQPRRRGTGQSILMAAMLGLADALGYERPSQEIVQVGEAPSGDDDLRLTFGPLDPLDN